MRELLGHEGRVRALAYSPDGRRLASGGDDRTVRVWDVAGGTCLRELAGHGDWVRAVAFTPDGLLSGGWDDRVLLHPLAGKRRKGKELAGPFAGGAWGLALRSDGALAVGCGDGTARVYASPTASGKSRAVKAHDYPVRSLAWSPDGKVLATGSHERNVKLWDGDWLQARATAAGHAGWVCCLAWSPDGARLASGADTGEIRLWTPAGAEALPPLVGHAGRAAGVAFAPGGLLLSAGWDGTVRTWSAADGRERDVRDWGVGRLDALALSPDGMTAAVAGDAGRIVVWDLE